MTDAMQESHISNFTLESRNYRVVALRGQKVETRTNRDEKSSFKEKCGYRDPKSINGREL